MARTTFKNDRQVKALKPAEPGIWYDAWDQHRSNLVVRVGPKTDKGSFKKTFALVARFNGAKHPTRRALGDYPGLSLEKARAKADRWNELIHKGIDPKAEEERERLAELRKQADTFDAVAEEFIKRVLPKQRRGQHVARELRQEFAERWKGRSITSIARRDVIGVINETLDRGATYQAHNLLGHVRAMFNWAIEVGDYGLETSPCDRIRPKVLIGERKPRQRVLDDAELRAFWQATERIGYPFGPLFRLLLLTGARKNELAKARWQEIDRGQRLLTVPPERFKSDSSHIIPLTAEAMAVLETLPTFEKGDYLFSTTFGERPVTGFAKAKERLDRLMAEELGAELKAFRTHDLRRTVRTRLASLRVSDTIAEVVIGHGKRGLQRVYDQHKYEPEMREALELWAARLRDIVAPPPENVVKLKERA
jgi:integrase